MYSQTGWADRAEIFRIVKGVDCRAVRKFSSRSDPYGQFYRPIKAKMAIKIRNPEMATSWPKKSFDFFLYFCVKDSELYDVCSTIKNVHS